LQLLSYREDEARRDLRSAPTRSVTLELPVQFVVFVFEAEIDTASGFGV
jgi:hypothetical protein